MNPYEASVIAAIVGAGVALFANYWRTRYTARAQDFSKRVEDVATLITKLEVISCEYWGRKEPVSLDIVEHMLGLQAKIGLMLEFLDRGYKNFNEAQVLNEVRAFSEACTGGTFGQTSQAREVKPEQIREILYTGEKLKIALLETRALQY